MARLNSTFDAHEYEELDDYEPIPPGWYQAEIEESDIKATASGTGRYVWFKLRILGPTHANRVCFDQINVVNRSPKASEIGRRRLAQVARAAGKPVFNDTEELHRLRLEIKVKVRRDEGYDPKNEVVAYRPVNAAPAARSQGAPSRSSSTTGDSFGGNRQQSPTPKGASNIPSFSDDEIPF